MSEDNSYLAELFGHKTRITKAPFAYPGSKASSLDKLLDILPYANTFVEPFCGCAIVTLARDQSPLEVINDRYSGVTDFYRCIQDQKLLTRLIEKIELSIHSRDFWSYASQQWSSQSSLVDRAFLWYYCVRYSFGSIGRNFGRCTSGKTMSGKLLNNIPDFTALHNRLKNVCVENRDYETIVEDYDHPDAVFYFDPPYLSTTGGQPYKSKFTLEDHRRLVEIIMDMQGYAALSGYANNLYDEYEWDEIYTWTVNDRITPLNESKPQNKRGKVNEYLYVKEAK